MKNEQLRLHVLAFVGFASMLEKVKPGSDESHAVHQEIADLIRDVWRDGFDKGQQEKGKPRTVA